MKQLITKISFILSMLPLLASFICFLFIFPDTIPVHWNLAGNITGYAGKSSILLVGTIFTLSNLMCTFFTINTEKHIESGIVHGVKSPASARLFLFLTVIVLDIVFIAIAGVTLANS